MIRDDFVIETQPRPSSSWRAVAVPAPELVELQEAHRAGNGALIRAFNALYGTRRKAYRLRLGAGGRVVASTHEKKGRG